MLFVCCDNNRADTVLQLFEDEVSRRDCPHGHGMENYYVAEVVTG